MIFSKINQQAGIGAKLAGVIFVLLIGFLIFYVNNARNQVDNILKINEHLHQFLFLNKKIDVILEKDMKYYNYDNIELLTFKIQDILESVKKLSIDGNSNKDLKNEISEISLQLDTKLELLEEFKSTNAVLNNSYRYIMTLSNSFEEVEYNKEYQEQLHRVLMTILSLSNNNYIDISSEIENINLLEKLKGSQNKVNKYFLLHSKLILNYYAKFTQIRVDNKNLMLEIRIKKLITDYDLYNEKLIDNISLVIAILIFIIIAFLLLFIRLYYQLEIIVQKRTQELKDLNNNLEIKVKEEVFKNTSQEKQLIQQSRSASMGEMMGAIIHQWKQPLNVLSMTNSSMQLTMMMGGVVSKEEIEKNVEIIENQLKNMNTTMEDFRNFFKPQKLTEYNVNDSISDVLKLVGTIYETSRVNIKVDIKNLSLTNGYPNELNQVIINILNNARDIIVEKDCEVRDIFIKSYSENDMVVITITDCAGGVPLDIIDNIFDPYVTTKSDENGTGIGLDMSKSIIEKVDGKLTVQNVITNVDGVDYDGAQFEIALKIV